MTAPVTKAKTRSHDRSARGAARAPVHVGLAGWAIRRQHAASFPAAGSHLERYARRFNAVEINSSFYRPHRHATYARWAAAVPPGFAFAVKAPREITHRLRLAHCGEPLDLFLAQAAGLGDRLGPLLFQLPPSLAFDARTARSFFAALRQRFPGAAACEPRHPSWFTPAAADLLKSFRIARVAADPPVAEAGADPGGWAGLAYFRLHGSPRVYYSPYGADKLERVARCLVRAARRGSSAWCILDNTAAGAAVDDGFALQRLVSLAAE